MARQVDSLQLFSVLMSAMAITAHANGQPAQEQLDLIYETARRFIGRRVARDEIERAIRTVGALPQHEWGQLFLGARGFDRSHKKFIIHGTMLVAAVSPANDRMSQRRMFGAVMWVATQGLGLSEREAEVLMQEIIRDSQKGR